MRQHTIEAIKQAFTHPGMEVYQGFICNITQTQITLPCVWINPIEMTELSGRNDRQATYNVTLYLFVQDQAFSEQQKEQQWDAMERTALTSLTRLSSSENPYELSSVRMTPDEFAYTGFREISLKVTFNITAYDCERIA